MINSAANTAIAGPVDLSYDTPVLLTERLVLRPPHHDDVPELAVIANNRQIAEMTSRIAVSLRSCRCRDLHRRLHRR